MEVREPEMIVIAKPAASRPSCSSFKSFSELLAGAIQSSPPTTVSEIIVPIKPKTVRIRPSVAQTYARLASSQGEESGSAVSNASDRVLKAESVPTVIYKPFAKLVSKTTATLLANLGDINTSHQLPLAQSSSQIQDPDKERHHAQEQPSFNFRQKYKHRTETDETTEPPKSTFHNRETNQKSAIPPSCGDRSSYDGYNWRKYGQKQVKGSEYPRSYYKCTHPNCLVKKKVERSLDGQIAEIVYKGEHDHPKPQPPKRLSSGAQGDGSDKDSGTLHGRSVSDMNKGPELRLDGQNEFGYSVFTNYSGKISSMRNSLASVGFNNDAGNPDNSCGLSVDCEEGSRGVDGFDDEPTCKRRKCEEQSVEVGPLANEPRIVVQSSTETEILEDGFRWRKYGQKVVKGNPYPRSYYRCTNVKCNVRKHVERASDDPRAFITTYEGKHNHEMPVSRSLNPGASETDSPVSSKFKS